MKFDHYTISLLLLNPDVPEMSEEVLDELQDQHLAHLADLHSAGLLLAAGPLPGEPDRYFRGLSVWSAEPDRVRELVAEHPDPAVAVGRFTQVVIPWMVPAGLVHFERGRLPRSMAEASAGDA
jgi:uncharacterized protein YciI